MYFQKKVEVFGKFVNETPDPIILNEVLSLREKVYSFTCQKFENKTKKTKRV